MRFLCSVNCDSVNRREAESEEDYDDVIDPADEEVAVGFGHWATVVHGVWEGITKQPGSDDFMKSNPTWVRSVFIVSLQSPI